MKRRFLRYVRGHWQGPLLLGLCCGLLFLLNLLYHGPAEQPRYTSLLLCCVGALFYLLDFGRWARRQAAAEALARMLPAPLDFSGLEGLYAPDEPLPALVRQVEALRIAGADRLRQRQADASDYYTLWAHQVKTPLAALRLLVQEDPALPGRGAYLQELCKLEQYVDMVLSYAKLDSFSADLYPVQADLAAPVAAAAKRVSPLFIHQSHTSLQVEDVHLPVVTDEKWLAFALEQLLTNAVKYTPSGTVRLYLDPQRPATLVVEDSGIGIAAEDLPRIGQRGFTGQNGRLAGGRRSTGIGLYLTKEILGRLGHGFAIDSAPGKGTRVRISFSRPDLAVD